MATIGERIRTAREEAGFSQDDLAEESGVSQSTIARIELGQDPRATDLAALAKALGIDAQSLLPGSTAATPHGRPVSLEDRVAALERDRDRMRRQLLKTNRTAVSLSKRLDHLQAPEPAPQKKAPRAS
jgi:transcriptional regulator with XRE-family HTH domain